MPRPKLKPTDEERALVKHLAAVGTPQNQISKRLRIRSEKTLRKYFRDEIDLGAMEANASVAGDLYKSARSGNVEAQKFWLSRRAGWGLACSPVPNQPQCRPLSCRVMTMRRRHDDSPKTSAMDRVPLPAPVLGCWSRAAVR